MTSRDLDGDGPNVPVVTVSGDLLVNTTYSGAVTFLNESVTPVDDITVEVKKKVWNINCFSGCGSNGALPMQMQMLTVKIGLAFTLRTGAAAAAGSIVVILRHEPLKSAAGVASGSITNAAEQQMQVTYPVQVK
jgi:hypothetical protein